MDPDFYVPRLDILKPYFRETSRIDNKQKAFAFLIGIILGALLQDHTHTEMFAHSGMPSLSNLFVLTGRELSGLFDSLLAALPACPKEHRATVFAVVEETKHLRASLANDIDLDESATTYFILYGISVSSSLLDKGKSNRVGFAKWFYDGINQGDKITSTILRLIYCFERDKNGKLK